MRNSANTTVLARGRRRAGRHNLIMHKRNGSPGVTLIELCFSVALIAVLATLAVPSFQSALRAAAIRSALFELVAGLQQTRADSILEARPGVLCLSDGPGNCLAGMDSSNA
jgi:Tfp pilus assembly protein FimT